ncbi:hypothetical protein [Paraflavitalea speifideaquila]|uniref:hypothetical protein n=1 Tax=Paraflavitalea speifideaquila TaxID=3076558 RepID=UPI0028E51637|nr:hypothetical protein [Paraflavitalea speifideiaquila]
MKKVKEKGRSPFINAILNRPGEGGAAHQEDTTCKLLFKSRTQGPANGEDTALLNAHHTTGSRSDQVIQHNKTFKMKNNSKTLRHSDKGACAQAKWNAE